MSSKSAKTTDRKSKKDDVVKEAEVESIDNVNDPEKEEDKAPGGDELIEDKMAEAEEAFHKKWAGPLILGPFVPALLSIIIILSGQIVLYTFSGTCGYPLQSFISAAITICYLFLLVYSWVFIGDRIRLKIDFMRVDRVIFVPFSSLKWLMGFYLVLGVASFIIWIVGSVLLQLGWFCATTSPGLYSYVTFLVTVYWMGFIIIVLYVIKLIFGQEIMGMIKEQIRAPTMQEVEERIFKRKFYDIDKEKSGVINRDDMTRLLTGLGVYVPSEEMPALLRSLDPDDTGTVKYGDALAWFKKLNAQAEADVEEEEQEKGAAAAGAAAAGVSTKDEKSAKKDDKNKKKEAEPDPEEDDGLM
jgi:hypothetical protein